MQATSATCALNTNDDPLKHRISFLFGRLVGFKRGTLSIKSVSVAVRSALAEGVVVSLAAGIQNWR
jgi:hypothetical protein